MDMSDGKEVTRTFQEEDRGARKGPPDGEKWIPRNPPTADEERGKTCFAGEEVGQGGGTEKPLVNEARPSL
jgi:hypothetical protein